MNTLINVSYFVAAILFIFSLKRMGSPVTARTGVYWAGWGMVLAVLVSFFKSEAESISLLPNLDLILIAIILGSAVAWFSAKRAAMTDMPQMIALYNGMGGGAAGIIAAIELMNLGETHLGDLPAGYVPLAALGGLIGSVSFSGSLIAFAKLQGWINRTITFSLQNIFNAAIFIGAVVCGVAIVMGSTSAEPILGLFILALAFGVFMTLPIGGADMPVVISLFNALTGLAVGFEGYVLGNAAMMIAGTVVGAAGTMLTQLMAKAMNRSLFNVLFGSFSAGGAEAAAVEGSMKAIDDQDAAIMMAYADSVVIVPGYGMAVAQAQHKVWELAERLLERGVTVKFAIHPVAGRMPGHMNVLLAEAGVPYDYIYDLEDINNDFGNTDVTLVIGANDVVNPAAKTDTGSPIYGMPILNAENSKNVLVIKRGQGKGYSGVENALFFKDQTQMLYGDGQAVVTKLIQSLKTL